MKIPRVVIGGVTSNVGKTSITLGLIYGLINQGYKVQAFKVGPDYIDPSYHSYIANRESRNLDIWLMGERGVLKSFVEASKDADISIIEGVMGLFDGISGKSNKASTAHVARLLKAPIILVVDASKTARSIAAIVYGFMRFDPHIEVKGVIINNVASDKHAKYCLDSLKGLGIEVFGIVKRNDSVKLEERYLGLIPVKEDIKIRDKIKAVAKYFADQLYIRKIIEVAYNAKDIDIKIRDKVNESMKKVKIGLALDSSFNFYYADNLDRLKINGGEIVPFSPLYSKDLPEVDGLYIGGGFPEILADGLSTNTNVLNAIYKASNKGMPIYAECGGLMYLSKYITIDSKKYRMVGIFDLEITMTKRLTLSYTYADVVYDNIIVREGEYLKGHEFHYSTVYNVPKDVKFTYKLKNGKGVLDGKDGITYNNTLASYMHIYFNDKIAKRFIESCIKYKQRL